MTRAPSHITTLLSRHTRRRDLILAGGAASFVLDCLSGASAAYPAAGKVARVGVLGDAPWPSLEGLQQGLHDLGYIEGENLRFEFRWARGQPELYPALAAELVGVPVDVIVTWGTPTVLAARGATGTIPIVMGGVGDPVAAGIVSSLAHPGGNITEFSSLSAELDPKRLEILKDLIPHLSCAVALSNPTNPICAIALRRLRPAAETLGVKLDVVELGEEGEIEEGFDAVRRARPEAVLVLADLFLLSQRKRIAEFMTASRLPSIYNFPEHVEEGGLLGYGADDRDLLRRAAGYVNRILNGEKPGDFPVQQAERFDLLINLKTAAAIGLRVPPTILDRADEVIE